MRRIVDCARGSKNVRMGSITGGVYEAELIPILITKATDFP